MSSGFNQYIPFLKNTITQIQLSDKNRSEKSVVWRVTKQNPTGLISLLQISFEINLKGIVLGLGEDREFSGGVRGPNVGICMEK